MLRLRSDPHRACPAPSNVLRSARQLVPGDTVNIFILAAIAAPLIFSLIFVLGLCRMAAREMPEPPRVAEADRRDAA